jgi:hypothetical protein
VRASLNGRHIADLQLVWNPSRVGAYETVVSRAVVHRGLNRLTLEAASPSTPAFSVWYIRIRQPSTVAQTSAR